MLYRKPFSISESCLCLRRPAHESTRLREYKPSPPQIKPNRCGELGGAVRVVHAAAPATFHGGAVETGDAAALRHGDRRGASGVVDGDFEDDYAALAGSS